jgi:uncharacterized oxidoreductase
MPIIAADPLRTLVIRIFEAAGVDSAIAHRTADHLVDANLAGVDSHGVMRVPDYVALVERGRMARTDKIEVVREFAATALWDAHYTFGQHSAWRAAEAAMNKAWQFGIGLIAVRNSAHIGRLGEYAERMAQEGFVGFITANLQGAGQRVAPHGGRYARLSTNPMAWGMPTSGQPMVIDMSTSASAEGKIRVKMRRGESLPPGWLLDKDGNPTLDPANLYTQPSGAIQTAGGHKGYGLSLVAEALAGILPGGGWSQGGREVLSLENGFSIIAIHIEALGALPAFKAACDSVIAYCKATDPVDGVAEVLVPGEPETRERQRRGETGIPIEDESWQRIAATATTLNVALPEL